MFVHNFVAMSAAGAEMFDSMHHITGIPYWGVVVGSTVAFRLAISPLMVCFVHNLFPVLILAGHVVESGEKVADHQSIAETASR